MPPKLLKKPLHRKRARRKVPRQGGVTRRTAVKTLATIGGALLLGGFGAGLARASAIASDPGGAKGHRSVTALRKASSVKKVIESWPDIVEKEMAWYKEYGKLGEMNTLVEQRDRAGDIVHFKSVPKNSRSLVHTPPFFEKQHSLPPIIRRKRGSRGSPLDLFSLMVNRQLMQISEKNQLRSSPIAAVNEKGIVIGYFTIRIGKDLWGDQNRLGRIRKYSFETIEKIKSFYKNKDWKELEKEYDSFYHRLRSFKSVGLQTRTTPMPGYEFKNGIFQEKV